MAQYPARPPTDNMPCTTCPIKTCCGSEKPVAATTPACPPPEPVCVAPPLPKCTVTVVQQTTGCCGKCIYSGSLENKKPPTICDCHDGKKIRVCPEHMPLPKRWNFYQDEPLSPKDNEHVMHYEAPPSRTGGSDVDPCCALVCPPPKPGCCPQFPPNAKSC